MCQYYQIILINTLFFLDPSAGPLNVTGYDKSSSSLNISWLPLHVSEHEGILLGHTIYFKALENCTEEDAHRCFTQEGLYDCPGATNTSCIMTGLSLDMPYEILVAGYTIVGRGPWSDPVNITTGYYGKRNN